MRSGAFFCAVLFSGAALGQGLVGDVLMGDLVNPKMGAWAWYDLSDARGEQTSVMRLAIVGEERVGLKAGHWLEMEVVPLVGYRSVYKMLLTGPASNPKNVHKVLLREGRGEVEDVPLPEEDGEAKTDEPPDPERKLVGEEEIAVQADTKVKAEHYELVSDGKKVEVWLNEDVRPLGIVRMVSPSGELKLRAYGLGGQDARSVINDPLPAGGSEKIEDMKVEVGVGEPEEKAPAPGAPAAPPENPKTPKPAPRKAEE